MRGESSFVELTGNSLEDRIVRGKLAWVLLLPEGLFRLATPMGFAGLPGLPSADLTSVLESFAKNSEGWGLVVSRPRELADTRVLDQLAAVGARPFAEDEWETILRTGMEVPFGEWASRSWADLYLLSGEEAE